MKSIIVPLKTCCLALTVLALGLSGAAPSAQANAKPAPVYAGVAWGTNQPILDAGGRQLTDSHGAPVFHNEAVEITNEGGQTWQESDLIIYPDYDADGSFVGLMAYGLAVSHKPKGDLYISYVLHEPVEAAAPTAFTGQYTIVGGTGLYLGASGAGQMFGQDFGDGAFRNHFQGTLLLAPAPRQ
jgi:hypothetical protein